jgi:hypothetical protein
MRCGISSGITTSSTEALLRQTPASAPKLIVVESVYVHGRRRRPDCCSPPAMPPTRPPWRRSLSYRHPRFSTRCEGFHTSRVGQNGLITAASQRIGERIQAWFSPPGYDTEGGFARDQCRALQISLWPVVARSGDGSAPVSASGICVCVARFLISRGAANRRRRDPLWPGVIS